MPAASVRFHRDYNYQGAVLRALTQGKGAKELDESEVPKKALREIGTWTDTTQSYVEAPIGKDNVFVHVDDMLAGNNMDEGFIAANSTGHVVASGSFKTNDNGDILKSSITFDALAGAPDAKPIAGLPAQRLEPTKEVQDLAAKLRKASDGNMVAPATLQFVPSALKKKLGGAGEKAFVFDLVKEAAAEDFSASWADTPRAGKSVKEIRRGDVFTALWDALEVPSTIGRDGTETQASLDAKKAAKEDVRKLVASLLSEPSDKVYLTNWNNQDDTNVFGVVAVNSKAGRASLVKVVPSI